jgi:hypothetical protein
VVDGEAQYIAALAELAELGSPDVDATKWNQIIRALEAALTRLRGTTEGLASVERQLDHPDAVARTWAASHVASWNDSLARPVLEELAQLPGIVGFNAEQTLRALDAGSLST